MARKKRSKERRTYDRMVARCSDPSHPKYPWYGGRGIRVCEEWLGAGGFSRFFADMGPAPTPKHTIERENNALGYHPQNCRWATMKEQAQNRRSSVVLELGGLRMTMSQWADRLGVDRRALWKRLNGKTPMALVDALTTPFARRRAA